MLVIAHRGASAYAPEHTFAAWDLALARGADYIEQDLQMTSDGVLVVLHDDTLDRTATGCTGRVMDHTAAELRDCDVGSWFNRAHPERARPEYAGQRIPTLPEVFERYADRASFYIETKNPEEAPGMEEALLRLLDEHRLRTAAAREWRVIIQSFSEASLRKIHALDPDLPLIRLLHPGGMRSRGIARRLASITEYAVGIGPAARSVNEQTVAAARHLGLEVHPWTVNDEPEMTRLIQLGVTGMFTDAPDRLLRLRPPDEPRGRDAARAAAGRHRPPAARESESGEEV